MADNRANCGLGEAGNKARAKAPSPVSVRGISRKACARASKVAARQHETIGEWVTKALTQATNEKLSTGPRRSESSQYGKARLRASSEQDDIPFGKALLNQAERAEGFEYNGGAVDVIAEQISLVETIKPENL